MTEAMKTSEHSDKEQGNHHILGRREMEERLAETAYDEGWPDKWPEMHMDASRCPNCGRWLQIVRPGKYQCECEHETVPAWRERQALEGMRRLAELLEPFACRGNCNSCPGAPAMSTREACEARMWLEGGDADTQTD